MPPQMRTSLCSWSICAKLVNWRDRRASEVSVATKPSGPLPKTASRTPRAAPALIPACEGCFQMHRRGVQWLPACAAFGRIVAVLVAVADRGDRRTGVLAEIRVRPIATFSTFIVASFEKLDFRMTANAV